MRAGVTMTADNLAKVQTAVELMRSSRVLIGVPSDKDSRTDSGKLGNAEIGYIMEFGSPEANIPARPHLVPGVKSVSKQSVDYLRQAGALALEGKPDGVLRALNAAGLRAQAVVRGLVSAGLRPPLAASTLAARRRRGRTGDKPLIDTGQYLAAITYVIRRRGRA